MSATTWWRKAAWSERFAEMFRDVRTSLGNSRDAKQIVGTMMFGKRYHEIMSDDDLHRHLLAQGVSHGVRSLLKEGEDDDSGKVTSDQLALWPRGHHRTLVENIGRRRVYVPSRGEFLELEPTQISPIEAKEAGKFLHVQAGEMRRRGDFLIELGDLGWK
jgi:hypothetical protein